MKWSNNVQYVWCKYDRKIIIHSYDWLINEICLQAQSYTRVIKFFFWSTLWNKKYVDVILSDSIKKKKKTFIRYFKYFIVLISAVAFVVYYGLLYFANILLKIFVSTGWKSTVYIRIVSAFYSLRKTLSWSTSSRIRSSIFVVLLTLTSCDSFWRQLMTRTCLKISKPLGSRWNRTPH